MLKCHVKHRTGAMLSFSVLENSKKAISIHLSLKVLNFFPDNMPDDWVFTCRTQTTVPKGKFIMKNVF